MAIPLNDNIKVAAPKPSDPRYLNSTNNPYVDFDEVFSLIPLTERHIGLTVNINNVDYWFKDGVDDYFLIIKGADTTQDIGGYPSNIFNNGGPYGDNFIKWNSGNNAWEAFEFLNNNTGIIFDTSSQEFRLGFNQRVGSSTLFARPGATIAFGYSYGVFGFGYQELFEITGSDSGGDGATIDIGLKETGNYLHFEKLESNVNAKMLISSATKKGLQYANNYATGFTKHSLVDLNFVTGYTSGGGTISLPANEIAYGNGSSITSTPSFVFDGNHLGIGTSTPSRYLDIEFNENSFNGFRITNTNNGANATIQNSLVNDAGSIAYYGLSSSNYSGFLPLDGGKAYFGSYNSDTSILTQSENDIIFYPNATEALRIHADASITFKGTPTSNYQIVSGELGVTDFNQFSLLNGAISNQFYSADFSTIRSFQIGEELLFDSLGRAQIFTNNNGSVILHDNYWKIGTDALNIYGDRSSGNNMLVSGIMHYQGNYISGFTSTSLVSKQYVDTVGNTLAGNGLSKNGNRILLGGGLTGTTTITTSSSNRLNIAGYPMQYSSDMTVFYNNRSLPDKEYVDKKIQSGTPISASDTGVTGQIKWDANYIYVCTSTNTWTRSPLSTW